MLCLYSLFGLIITGLHVSNCPTSALPCDHNVVGISAKRFSSSFVSRICTFSVESSVKGCSRCYLIAIPSQGGMQLR